MNSFYTRTFFGFLFAVVMVGSIYFSSILLAMVLLFVNIVGNSEMNKLHKESKYKKGDKFLFGINNLFLYVILAAAALEFVALKTVILALIPLLFPFIHSLFSRKLAHNRVSVVHWYSLLFIALPTGLMLFFYNEKVLGEMAGSNLLLVVIAFIWINDTFAYLIGSMFGKHKLFERISPKKTWEGSFGGLAFTILAAYILTLIANWIELPSAMMIAILVVVFGGFGDLIESMFKRQANVKDSGKILPGHGGILDRFDATFFAIPFVFIYLIMIQ